MTSLDIEKSFIELIGSVLNLDSLESITGSSHFSRDLGAESIDMPLIGLRIEKQYGVKVPDDVLADLNVSQLWHYIDKFKRQ